MSGDIAASTIAVYETVALSSRRADAIRVYIYRARVSAFTTIKLRFFKLNLADVVAQP